MTPRRLYLAVYRAGVTYWQTPAGTLGYRAANGLSDELKATMQAQRDDLLYLCADDVTVYGKGQESAEWRAARRWPRRTVYPVAIEADTVVPDNWQQLMEVR